MRTCTEVVIACENTLGYLPDTTKRGLTSARRIDAGILKRAMTKASVTFADLELALAYSYAKRLPVKHPAGLVYRVEDARADAEAPTSAPTAVSATVEAAMAWELAQLEPDQAWIGRLTRAHGTARTDLLTEWTRSGRGQ